MRKVWKENYRLADLMIEHHHPENKFCPIGGFGRFDLFSKEIFEKSDRAAEKIVGKTVEQMTSDMINALIRKNKV